MFNIAVELGKSTCASSAWVLNYFTDHALHTRAFRRGAARRLEPRQGGLHRYLSGGVPTSKVSVTSGGYHLNGRWSWCSGLRYSQWIMIGGLIFREGEDHPDMRLFLVPVSDIKQDDTRYQPACAAPARSPRCAIMYSCRSTETVTFGLLRDACSPGSKINTNPIYRTPFIAVHTYALLGPKALGLRARGGYADFIDVDAASLSHLYSARHRAARACATKDRRDRCADRRGRIAWRGPARLPSQPRDDNYTGMTMETRTLLRRDFTYAMRMLRDAMDLLIADHAARVA